MTAVVGGVIPGLGDVEKYAGVMALACFAGVLLGGMALSYFWKVFGPWKQLEEAKAELRRCQDHRTEADAKVSRVQVELAEVRARYDVLIAALREGDFFLAIDKRPLSGGG